MKSRLFCGTIVLALACGIGGAAAQAGPPAQAVPPGQSQAATPAQVRLDAAQKTAILTAVRDTKIPPPGHSFNASVGAQVPPSIELYALPISALSQAPEARTLRYTMVQNQVVLVDPTNMRVVEVIAPPRQ